MLSTRVFGLFLAGIAVAAGPLACSGGDGSGTTTDDAGAGVDAGGLDGGGGGLDGGGGSDSAAPATLTWAAGAITGDGAANVGGISAMAFGGGKFVAFATAARGAVDNNGYALTSTDGKAWTVAQKYALNSTMRSIAYTGTGFFATGASLVPVGNGIWAAAVPPDNATSNNTTIQRDIANPRRLNPCVVTSSPRCARSLELAEVRSARRLTSSAHYRIQIDLALVNANSPSRPSSRP